MWPQNYEWILFGCIIIITTLFLFKGRKKKNTPPGPTGTFLIGNTFLLKPRAYEMINELSKKYGSIYQFSFLGQPIVVLSEYKVLKEAFVRQGDVFSGRPKAHVWEVYSSKSGISFNQGEEQIRIRKLALQILKRLGYGKEIIVEKIETEIECLCKYIKDENGKPLDLKSVLMQTGTNIIQSVAFSNRVDYHSSDKDIVNVIDGIFEGLLMTNPINFCPPLGYFSKSFREYKENIKSLKEMLTKVIKDHEKTFDINNIRDYIDAYLEKEQENEKVNANDPVITRINLLSTLSDFFLGGTETISTTMLWAILYLMHHPDIQLAVYKELNSVCGPSKLPKMSDRKDLPFTMATMLEVQRFGNIVPLSIAHSTTDNAQLCGYDIPKGAWIIPNLTAVHFDPNYWQEPHKFDPNRFLDSNKMIKQNVESFMPFSMGPRTCLGEALAKTEFFLIFSTLFKCFEFKPSPGETLPSMTDNIEALVVRPLPYKCCVIPR